MTSGLQDITYQQLVDVVKNYIKTNCTNITNYAGIPAVFKAGYSNQYTIPGGNAAATCYCTTTITGGDIVQATASDVDTDMNNFIETIYSKQYLSQYIKDSELIKFVNDLVIFCSTRLLYSTSVLNSSKYLIYSKSQSTSDFSWHYENDSLTSKYLYKHLKEDCEYYKEIYYKCTSKETGDIIYTTKTNFVPDNFDQTTYDYIMDYKLIIEKSKKIRANEKSI